VSETPDNGDAVIHGEGDHDERTPEQILRDLDRARWMQKARDGYDQSSDWFDASMRPTIEKAMAHFQNRHAPGAKYYTDSYKFRAKGFRPKTRASIRRNEAAAAVAFFSTQDVVTISAENATDRNQVMSAKVLTEVLNYRLDDSIPWFLILIGAYQDAMNTGVVISCQDWHFKEIQRRKPTGQRDPETGEDVTETVVERIADKPRVSLVAIENFRLSPAADWSDPINSSPYVIELIPMFIGDVEEQMDAGEWISYETGDIHQAARQQYDTIRAAREGKKRTDPADLSHATTQFDLVWVHRNIVREAGEDFIFYSLGTTLLLSDPIPLREACPHLMPGERPYVMGSALIETHRTYTTGLNELTFGLQEEANEIQNQRRDNVSLVMNKRYFARRTANIDFRSLTRNVPGSVTLMDDINTDIKWDTPGEVTGSSYQEQDRVSVDYDELAGTFSPGSVQTNRQLNETVGGMKMLSGDANAITEYQLRVFAETWVEPVLKQLVQLEQYYEDDQTVLAVAGQRAKLMERYGISEVNDALLKGRVKVRCDVGFGSTNPQQRIEKLAFGLNTIAAYLPSVMTSLDGNEVVTEVLGALGYKGAERFFPSLGQQENPEVAQLKQMVQQLQAALQSKQMEVEGRIKVAEIGANGRIQQESLRQKGLLAISNAEAAADFQLARIKASLEAIDRQLEGQRNQIEVGRLQNERAALIAEMRDRRRELANNELMANPTGAMSTTLSNRRFGMVPGAQG